MQTWCREGATGDQIIEALIANSSTFEKKTLFSQVRLPYGGENHKFLFVCNMCLLSVPDGGENNKLGLFGTCAYFQSPCRRNTGSGNKRNMHRGYFWGVHLLAGDVWVSVSYIFTLLRIFCFGVITCQWMFLPLFEIFFHAVRASSFFWCKFDYTTVSITLIFWTGQKVALPLEQYISVSWCLVHYFSIHCVRMLSCLDIYERAFFCLLGTTRFL